MQDAPRNILIKFGLNWSSICQRIFLKEITLQIDKERRKREITWLHRLNRNFTTDRSHHAEYFYPRQNLAEPNCFGDICEKLLSDPYVLF